MRRMLMVGVAAVLGGLLLVACPSLKEGECKRDSHCEGKGEGMMVCYKEPPEAEIGRCLSVKEAKAANDRYQRKLTGKCDDKDGDGVKAGDACDPPIDCDDGDPAVKPGATEVCDNKDNDCDHLINEGQAGCVGTMLGGKQDPVAQFMTTMTAGVEVAPNGEVWVSDQHQIYKLDKDGKASRIAGSNKPGNDDKKGTFARFDEPRGMAVGADGSVYITECRNNCVRRLAPDGQVSAYAGLCSSEADDTGLDKDGPAEEARFWCPIDITWDKDGSLLVVDMRNAKIKRIGKDRKVTTVAGAGGKQDSEGYIVFGHSNGPALKAEFSEPAGIAADKDGNVYIADMKNNCIRRLKDGAVSDFAGECVGGSDKGGYKDGPAASAKFNMPNSVDVGSDGSVWVADTGNHCVRKVQGGTVSSVAGKCGNPGYYDGPLDDGLFNQPQTLSLAGDGTVYVVDLGNYRLRVFRP